jgi:hypothetical protein
MFSFDLYTTRQKQVYWTQPVGPTPYWVLVGKAEASKPHLTWLIIKRGLHGGFRDVTC